MGELVTKLGIDWKLLLANALTFFIVLWVLRKFAYAPIMDVLDKRQKSIGEGLDAAQRSKQELAAIQADKQEILKEAKGEAHAILAEAKKQGEAMRQKLSDQASADAAATLARTKTLLERERVDMVRQAKTELADLVVAATGKVLDRTLKPADQTKLAQEAMSALEEVRE